MNWYLGVFKNYAGFSGRARRKEYWMFVLFHIIVAAVLLGVGIAIDSQIPYLVYLLAAVVPSLAVFVRRLHDTGRSGWWFLIGLIPVVGDIVLLVFMVSDGTREENQYGVNPKFA